MRRTHPKLAALAVGVALALFATAVYGVAQSLRADGGIRMAKAASPGTSATAGNPVIWADNTTVSKLRWSDGTNANTVSTCVPTTTGDYCSWNGSNFTRSAAPGAGASFDIATWVQNNPTTASSAGNLTVGTKFQVGTASTATAVKVYWAGGATTLRVRIYNNAGTSLQTGTQAVGGAGAYTINLGATQALTASTPYWASVYDTGATNYTSAVTSVGPTGSTTVNYLANFGPVSLTFLDNAYATGDVVPATSIGSQWFGAMPVYTTP